MAHTPPSVSSPVAREHCRRPRRPLRLVHGHAIDTTSEDASDDALVAVDRCLVTAGCGVLRQRPHALIALADLALGNRVPSATRTQPDPLRGELPGVVWPPLRGDLVSIDIQDTQYRLQVPLDQGGFARVMTTPTRSRRGLTSRGGRRIRRADTRSCGRTRRAPPKRALPTRDESRDRRQRVDLPAGRRLRRHRPRPPRQAVLPLPARRTGPPRLIAEPRWRVATHCDPPAPSVRTAAGLTAAPVRRRGIRRRRAQPTAE